MLTLSIVTPEKKLVTECEAEEVFVPGHRGELNVLPGHVGLITTLTPGVVRFKRREGNQEQIMVSWGYCEISKDKVIVLAETAETPQEIDIERANRALKKSEEALASASDPETLEKFRLKKERALVRISVARIK